MPVGGFLESVELSRELFVSFGIPGLFAVAFLEFFLLPIPPDLVLIPLVLSHPVLAPVYAATATAGSVLAGLVGYFVGRKGGRPVLDSQFSDERVERAEAYFERSGLATVTVGAFAPIPEGYELLSVVSGVLGLDLRTYLVASVLGRGGRYFLEAVLVLVLGDAARSLTEVELYAVLGVVAVLLVAVYLLRRRWMPERWRTASD
ncbi:DedA family protein [Halobacteriales archaeon QS_5_70_15]|nr:MAG: DedA family protein [Halobacteriales archaeon QS_5_70_15]